MLGLPGVWPVYPSSGTFLDPVLTMLATRIVVNSAAVAKRFGNSGKVGVIHNGVDLKKFNPEVDGERIREELAICEKEQIVTIVGRLDEWKGHRFFLEAARYVLDQLQTVRFLVVGDGVLRSELETLCEKLGIAKDVVFCGHREDISEVLAVSNVLVSPSRAESFGRVIIEAMAKPVVGTRAGGVPEIVVDGLSGILVEPEKSEEMAQAILLLLRDSRQAREMGVAGFNRVKECFSLEKHVCEIEEIYESL